MHGKYSFKGKAANFTLFLWLPIIRLIQMSYIQLTFLKVQKSKVKKLRFAINKNALLSAFISSFVGRVLCLLNSISYHLEIPTCVVSTEVKIYGQAEKLEI